MVEKTNKVVNLKPSTDFQKQDLLSKRIVKWIQWSPQILQHTLPKATGVDKLVLS